MRQVSAPVTAAVIVAAVEVPTASTTVNVKLADAASSRYWIWSLATPNLPANRIKVGDHFDLTIDARACEVPFLWQPCQTVVLAQGSKMVAFTVDLLGNEASPAGALDSWDVLVDAGVTCTQMSPSCEIAITRSS